MIHNEVPLYVKLPYTLLALIIFPIYWHEYGPGNFLWFSDIAFFVMVPALWLPSPFIASMMAIGVLPLEALWLISYASHGTFLGIANYMFDDTFPLWLRALSLFHFPMPAAIIYMIHKYGYDRRALWPQVFLGIVVVALSHLLTARSENVNMIFPPQGVDIPEAFYVPLVPLVLVFAVIIPMHFLLKKVRPR